MAAGWLSLYPPASSPGPAVGAGPAVAARRRRGMLAAFPGRPIMNPPVRVPPRAWVVVGAGTAVNLCLGILYAWSVWKAGLVADADHPAGSPMAGLNEGWAYLSDAEATWAYAVCGVVFALCMVPGG